jgi:hypothetical protein
MSSQLSLQNYSFFIILANSTEKKGYYALDWLFELIFLQVLDANVCLVQKYHLNLQG